MELSKKSENVQHRNWYQKNKRNPGFLERQRAYSKKSRDSRKDDPEYKQNRRQYDSAYRIGRIEQDSNYLMREREKKYIYLSRRREWQRAYLKEWKKNHPEQHKAHCIATYAIKTGKIQRPEACMRCGIVPPRTRDGRSGLHAHHEDYSKPLDVEFLCHGCHGKEGRKYA